MNHRMSEHKAAKWAKRHGYAHAGGKWNPPDPRPALKAMGRVVPEGSYKLPQPIFARSL